MLICVYFDAGRAERKQAFRIFAKVEDEFFGVKGTMLGLIDLFRHLNRKCIVKLF